MKKEVGMTFTSLLVAAFVVVMPELVHAINTPMPGSFAYDIYHIGVVQIANGPIGFVGGVAAVAIGAISAITGKIMMAIPAVLGGAALLNADGIVASMGMIM